jgi:hypothetical protein
MTFTSVLTFKQSEDVRLIDARGPRFGALITTAILTAALAFNSFPLILWQLGVFAIGAFISPQRTPYAWIYQSLIKPRLRGDISTEDIRPPQFAQIVGFLFLAVATTATLLGENAIATVVIGFALAAAFLNAAFNFCLGCEIYLLIARTRSAISGRKNAADSYNLPNL